MELPVTFILQCFLYTLYSLSEPNWVWYEVGRPTVEVEHAVLGKELHGLVAGGAVGQQVEQGSQVDH